MLTRAVSLLLFVPLYCAGQSDAELDRLRGLWESNHWFALRETLPGVVPQPLFYQAAVACAFHDLKRCEQATARFFKIGQPDAFPAAHNFLVALYMRAGRFREALKHREDILRLAGTPEQGDSLRRLLAAFSTYPDFSVASRHPSTVRGEFRNGHLFIPVFVAGVAGSYILDTGANFSTLTESEARRLGLRAMDLNVDASQIGDSSGKGVERPKFAVAERVSVGEIHLRNVPFLVVSDGPQAFSALPSGYRGALGIQVLLAFRTIRWDSDGTVYIDSPESKRRTTPTSNLCFSGLDTFAQATFANGALDVQVDTGADSSLFFQRFARQFPNIIRASGTPGTKWLGGAGGAADASATVLPEIAVRLGGLMTTLRPAYVLAKDVDSDGTVGMDILSQAREVLLDFQLMRLTLSK
jgi:predicted aspartyl protease